MKLWKPDWPNLRPKCLSWRSNLHTVLTGGWMDEPLFGWTPFKVLHHHWGHSHIRLNEFGWKTFEHNLRSNAWSQNLESVHHHHDYQPNFKAFDALSKKLITALLIISTPMHFEHKMTRPALSHVNHHRYTHNFDHFDLIIIITISNMIVRILVTVT